MMRPVATIGRNDPCPCGSGKKYKKCCLAQDEARAAEQRRATDQRNAVQRPELADVEKALSPFLELDSEDGLDELSGSAFDLANAGKHEEALAVCTRLLTDFPDVVDGLDRSAMVHALMGHHAVAADLYRQAYAFVTDPSRCDDYEDHDFYRKQAEEQQHLADSL